MHATMTSAGHTAKVAVVARRPFAPRRLRPLLTVPRPQMRRPVSVQVVAMRAWPDRELIADTRAAFPGKGIANVEEARALFSSLGYTFLDVRSDLECEDQGRVRGSVHIPKVYAARVWSPEEQRKVVVEEPNEEWVFHVQRRFPDPDTPLLVCCCNGGHDSEDAMADLLEAGYFNVVQLGGGFQAWSDVFDNKLSRRKSWQEQAPATPSSAAAASPRPPAAAAPTPPNLPAAAAPPTQPPAAAKPSGEVVNEQMMRLRKAEAELDGGVRALENEVKAARAALERALEKSLEGQALAAAAHSKAKDEQLQRYQEMLGALLACTTKLTAARAAMAAAEAEVKEREGDLAVLNEEVAAFMAKARQQREGNQS